MENLPAALDPGIDEIRKFLRQRQDEEAQGQEDSREIDDPAPEDGVPGEIDERAVLSARPPIWLGENERARETQRGVIDVTSGDPFDHAGMDRGRDENVVLAVVAQLFEAARSVAIVPSYSRTGVVGGAMSIGRMTIERDLIGVETQTRALGAVEHPDERNVGEVVDGIAAADVGMDAGEPNLADPRVVGRVFFVPYQRPEGRPFVIQRQTPGARA